ncbi:MAG: hypothetical protein HC849_30480 [Oscillatoriales cyanobacterium RU_3_3]|nr:hypothetical protein [Oscillatoriales cyanobacterium RU_3_3]
MFGSRGEAKRWGCPRDRKRVTSFELRDVNAQNSRIHNSKLFKITH